MRTYELKPYLPSWHPPWYSDPPTNRQLKLLRFFDFPIVPPPTKGRASGIIWRLCSDPANKHLWLAYLYSTGDEDDSSSELLPHDRAGLAQVVIPDDWQPKRAQPKRTHPTKTDNTPQKPNREALEAFVTDLLKERSPFNDPLPHISVAGKCFCFTGQFEFGPRSKCQQAVVALGGSCTEDVRLETDVLVIGAKGSPTWTHGNYGNKIEAAMLNQMRKGKPDIIPEAFWKELLHP